MQNFILSGFLAMAVTLSISENAIADASASGDSKVVKSATDRVCTETDGKLKCIPKKVQRKAKDMALNQTSRIDSMDAKRANEAESKAGKDTVAPKKDAPAAN